MNDAHVSSHTITACSALLLGFGGIRQGSYEFQCIAILIDLRDLILLEFRPERTELGGKEKHLRYLETFTSDIGCSLGCKSILATKIVVG